ncbi:MAG: hypothetical protein D3M94_06840 [Rhodocyclales bacterium GT-UBC]|nr:MAG: hypothetical protein D3M94_06840 [Rhodocyclales bacterium GT-UBC]
MKLNRLDSTTQHFSRESVERVRHVAEEQVRRVEACEGLEGDRQRSLQQELAEVDQKALGPFLGREQVLQEARQLAAELTSLGDEADRLIKPVDLPAGSLGIDDSV